VETYDAVKKNENNIVKVGDIEVNVSSIINTMNRNSSNFLGENANHRLWDTSIT
jgi:hypothetical protein